MFFQAKASALLNESEREGENGNQDVPQSLLYVVMVHDCSFLPILQDEKRKKKTLNNGKRKNNVSVDGFCDIYQKLVDPDKAVVDVVVRSVFHVRPHRNAAVVSCLHFSCSYLL